MQTIVTIKEIRLPTGALVILPDGSEQELLSAALDGVICGKQYKITHSNNWKIVLNVTILKGDNYDHITEKANPKEEHEQ